jgi:hypothetical protein
MATWYAKMMDNEDTDHGTGTFDKEEALEWLEEMRAEGNEEAYIAVIDDTDDFCIDEIR